MKAYIVAKYNYSCEGFDSWTETKILNVCLNKEIALKLYKKYYLEYFNKEIEIKRRYMTVDYLVEKRDNTIQRAKGERIGYDDWEIGIEEYNIVEKE